jgi:hypothetical protein
MDSPESSWAGAARMGFAAPSAAVELVCLARLPMAASVVWVPKELVPASA